MRRLSTFCTGITVLGALLLPPNGVSCETSQSQLPESASISDKISAIIDRVLKRGESSIGDVQTSRWVPPSADDIEQVRMIGQGAIPPLDKALDSHRPFEQLLAIRLLGSVGGANIVAPLKRTLGADKPNSVRMAALSALRSAPDDLALPIIRGAVHDPDPLVAQRAKQLLMDYYQLSIPD